ncbi:hypothetical protein ACB092_08G082400 [Castanea dentata]
MLTNPARIQIQTQTHQSIFSKTNNNPKDTNTNPKRSITPIGADPILKNKRQIQFSELIDQSSSSLEMDSENAAKETTPSSLSSLISLAFASTSFSSAQQPYFSKLLSFKLDRLQKELELLRVDAERIWRQMQEVAVS